MDDLRTNSDFGATAKVTSAGRPYMHEHLHFRAVDLAVGDVIWKADERTPVPDTIQVVQTVSPDVNAVAEDEDPPMLTDRTYVLFVKATPQGYRHGPAERFVVDGAGFVHPVVSNAVELSPETTLEYFTLHLNGERQPRSTP